MRLLFHLPWVLNSELLWPQDDVDQVDKRQGRSHNDGIIHSTPPPPGSAASNTDQRSADAVTPAPRMMSKAMSRTSARNSNSCNYRRSDFNCVSKDGPTTSKSCQDAAGQQRQTVRLPDPRRQGRAAVADRADRLDRLEAGRTRSDRWRDEACLRAAGPRCQGPTCRSRPST